MTTGLFCGPTCIDDNSDRFLCVADGAASQQKVVLVQPISPAILMDSVRLQMFKHYCMSEWAQNVIDHEDTISWPHTREQAINTHLLIQYVLGKRKHASNTLTQGNLAKSTSVYSAERLNRSSSKALQCSLRGTPYLSTHSL